LAITKQRKDELVTQYVEQLNQSKGIILVDYRGLGVNDTDGIRQALRPIGGKFQVIKNRLLKLALEEVGMSLPLEWLIGPTGVGFCYEEVPPVAKVFSEVAKELDTLHIKGGLVGASVVQAAQVQVIADLPPREVLLSQVLGTINAPASQVVGVVASGLRQILNVLQAHVDKLQESGETAGAAMEPAAEPA
jgi:large subunit ribosomal protein L10